MKDAKLATTPIVGLSRTRKYIPCTVMKNVGGVISVLMIIFVTKEALPGLFFEDHEKK